MMFFDADEARAHANARRVWLEAERRSAIEQIRKGSLEVGGYVGVEVSALAAARTGNFVGIVQHGQSDGRIDQAQAVDQAKQDHLQHPSMGSRVLQYLKLLFIHRKPRVVPCADGSDPSDSLKAKSNKKEAA